MPDFWLDSDVLTAAKDGLFAFDIAPRFWQALDRYVAAGRVSSPLKVYEELTTEFHGDQLAQWVVPRRLTHFTDPDDVVYSAFTRIANYVVATYEQAFANSFLDGADPWLIAHALAHGGQVVTNETNLQLPNPNRLTGRIRSRVKIPDVCRHFGVPTSTLPEMLRSLGVNDL